MAIEDRLARRNPEDIIYIGGVIEGFLDSDAGKVIQALLNGRVATEAKGSSKDPAPAERKLGRIEMCHILIDDLDQFLVDRNKLIIEMKKEKPKGEGVLTDGPEY